MSTSQPRITDTFGALDGAKVPGGCATCDAYQTIRPVEAGIWNMTVHHDDWCPTWERIESRRD